MTLFLQMASAMMEPIAMIGYLLCGLLLPRLWMAFGGAIGWAVLMNVWDTAQETARYAVSASELAVPRFAVALLIAAAAHYALNAWREHRAAPEQRRFVPVPQSLLKPVPMVAEEDDYQRQEPRQ